MRRLLIIAFLCALPAHAQFAFHQSTAENDATLNLTSITAGMVIAGCITWEGAAGTGNLAISDSGGGSPSTWVATTKRTHTNNDLYSQCNYTLNATATGSVTYTFTYPAGAGTVGRREAMAAFTVDTGGGAAVAFDQQNFANGTGTALVSGSITNTGGAAYYLNFGWGDSYSGGQTFSSRTVGGTAATGNQDSITGDVKATLFWLIGTTALSSATANATASVSDAWQSTIFNFTAGTSGGAPAAVPRRPPVITR